MGQQKKRDQRGDIECQEPPHDYHSVLATSPSQATVAESPLISPWLIGVLASFGFLIVRALCLYSLLDLPAGTHETRETISLVPQPYGGKHLSRSARFLYTFGAFAYIYLTVLAVFYSFLEHGHPVLVDPRQGISRQQMGEASINRTTAAIPGLTPAPGQKRLRNKLTKVQNLSSSIEFRGRRGPREHNKCGTIAPGADTRITCRLPRQVPRLESKYLKDRRVLLNPRENEHEDMAESVGEIVVVS
ncbi:hypothetical protein B0H13DRAFT_1900582 [Mycena leptocephala]|nr:hypothetical protein B0H13DRAFT_1900582 [Mycena leptocephala]